MKRLVTFAVLSLVFGVVAQAEPVEDNSFLVEESYNQEPGIVQFINVYQKSSETKDWSYVFINEIPVISQRHQFSYEIPFAHLESADKSALGDVKFNYRNELLRNEVVVSTGRLSVATSTGSSKDGFGKGSNTYEASLLASVKIMSKWVQHWNVGSSFTPGGKNTVGQSADNERYFWNLSNVYLITDNFNFMLETTTAIEETTLGADSTEWASSFIVSPSLRYAIDVSDWQFVPGIAFPFNLGPEAGSRNQILAYLSVEGQIW